MSWPVVFAWCDWSFWHSVPAKAAPLAEASARAMEDASTVLRNFEYMSVNPLFKGELP
jgi:hypothetical protein